MGLDWLVEPKPMPEHQAEYDELLKILDEGKDRDRRTFWQRLFGAPPPPDYKARYEEIAVIHPLETLNVPQVGQDLDADAWLRRRYDEMDSPTEPWPEYFERMKGHHVTALVRPCDGLPPYSDIGFGTVPQTSFQAQHLAKLWDRDSGAVDIGILYVSRTASELIESGRILANDARDYAHRMGVGEEAFERDFQPTDEEMGLYVRAPRFNVHVMISASRWCTFWGERGHAMQPWS